MRAIADVPDRIAVPLAEGVRLSGLSRSEIYRRIAAGHIEARKAGRSTLIMVDSLRAHLLSLPDAKIGTSRAAAERQPAKSAGAR